MPYDDTKKKSKVQKPKKLKETKWVEEAKTPKKNEKKKDKSTKSKGNATLEIPLDDSLNVKNAKNIKNVKSKKKEWWAASSIREQAAEVSNSTLNRNK